MNKKQFLILSMLTFVSVVAAVLTLTLGHGRFACGKVFFVGGGIPPFDVNSVTRINIEDSRGRLKLEKRNGMWIIPARNDYPANTLLISGFIMALKNVKAIKTLEADRKYWRTYGVDISSGTRETVTVQMSDSKGASLASIILGNMYYPPDSKGPAQQQPSGRYILSNTKGAVPFLAGLSFAGSLPDPAFWLDREFLKFPMQSLSSIKCLAPSGKVNWELRKSAGQNELSFANPPKGKPVSIEKIRAYVRKLSEITFDDLAPRKNSDAPDNYASLVIESGGAAYEIKIGSEKGKYLMTVIKRAVFGKAEVQSFFSKWTYGISQHQAEALNVPQSYFMLE